MQKLYTYTDDGETFVTTVQSEDSAPYTEMDANEEELMEWFGVGLENANCHSEMTLFRRVMDVVADECGDDQFLRILWILYDKYGIALGV